jgi:transposase InsO family protein
MGGNIKQYVRNCQACKRSHVPIDKTLGLLHSLPVPNRPWKHISMDFKSFPKDRNGYNTILVVVDRLSKQPVSLPCYKTTTSRDLAHMFIAHVWRYYGAPDSIVSDRGPQFISDFWDEFCKILGVKIKLSTAHHAQTDRQTEIVNKYID